MAELEINYERPLAIVTEVAEVWALEGASSVRGARLAQGYQTVVSISPTADAGSRGVALLEDAVPPAGATWVEAAGLSGVSHVQKRRVRGVISNCVFISMEDLPSEVHALPCDADVTQVLGVRKFVRDGADPVDTSEVAAAVRGSPLAYERFLPDGPPKTDEPRVEGKGILLQSLHGRPWVATVKIDGSSMTFFWDEVASELVVLSRNQRVLDHQTAYWRYAEAANLAEVARKRPDLVFQGEVYGPGVNGNALCRNALHFAVFSVAARAGAPGAPARYLSHDAMISACIELGLDTVPVVARGDSFGMTIEQLNELAKGKYDDCDTTREGIVVRSADDLQRVSFKVINADYATAKRVQQRARKKDRSN